MGVTAVATSARRGVASVLGRVVSLHAWRPRPRLRVEVASTDHLTRRGIQLTAHNTGQEAVLLRGVCLSLWQLGTVHYFEADSVLLASGPVPRELLRGDTCEVVLDPKSIVEYVQRWEDHLVGMGFEDENGRVYWRRCSLRSRAASV